MKTRVSKSRKKQKHIAPKPNTALSVENDENDLKKNKILDLNLYLTSTPKGMSFKEKHHTSPFLSPIPHNIDKRHESELATEVIKEEHSVALSEPNIHPFNTMRNILSEICQFGPSCKTGNTLSAPSVVDGQASSSACKLSVQRPEFLDVTVGAMLTDPVSATDVPSQIQSCKADERISSTMTNSGKLYVACSEARNLKESLLLRDKEFDSAEQVLMNDAVNGVSKNGSSLSSPVHEYKHVNLRRQKNREPKYLEGALYSSDDSFLGFSDVPPEQDLCGNTGKDSVVLSNSYPAHDNNQFSLTNEGTKKCKVNRNLSPSKPRNMSLILFDSWNSVNNGKLEGTLESSSDFKVCDKNPVLRPGMLRSHSQRLLYSDLAGRHYSKDHTVQNNEEGSWHVDDSGSHPAQESSMLNRDTGLLRTDISKCLPLQECPADNADESPINNQDRSLKDSTIHSADKGEMSWSIISKTILSESSVMNIGTGESNVNPRSFLRIIQYIYIGVCQMEDFTESMVTELNYVGM
jgi:hypothetical protein